MRCPKCHYLSFEPEPRCKNCGYDLAVAESDLAIKPAQEPEGPFADLTLHESPRARSRRAPLTLGLIHPVRDTEPQTRPVELAEATKPSVKPAAVAVVTDAVPDRHKPDHSEELTSFVSETPATVGLLDAPKRPAPRAPHSTGDLPLFVKAPPPEAPPLSAPPQIDPPLVTVPAAPRPLGVRRSAPEPVKPATKSVLGSGAPRKLGPFDRDLLEDLRRVEHEEAAQARADARRRAKEQMAVASAGDAGIGRRILAAFVDLALLGGITAAVVWATFRLCGVRPADVGLQVLLPLAGFLLLLNLGYLIMFTVAGGQTVGKMAFAIKVVGAPTDATDDRLTMRQAVYRELLTLPSLLPLGAGWLPAVVGKGPAVHDRLAHTRVVRA
jgi:uncharacterized RDD family membrane protein YckC